MASHLIRVDVVYDHPHVDGRPGMTLQPDGTEHLPVPLRRTLLRLLGYALGLDEQPAEPSAKPRVLWARLPSHVSLVTSDDDGNLYININNDKATPLLGLAVEQRAAVEAVVEAAVAVEATPPVVVDAGIRG